MKCNYGLWLKVQAEDAKRRAPHGAKKDHKLKKSKKKAPVKYGDSDEKQMAITRNLALFVTATSVPSSIVENGHFRSFVESCDPRYKCPGRYKLSMEIDNIAEIMKSNITSSLAQARKVNMCADLWSKKGLTSSYLGITCHYYSPRDSTIQHATLAVRRIPYPHTGLFILEFLSCILNIINSNNLILACGLFCN